MPAKEKWFDRITFNGTANERDLIRMREAHAKVLARKLAEGYTLLSETESKERPDVDATSLTFSCVLLRTS